MTQIYETNQFQHNYVNVGKIVLEIFRTFSKRRFTLVGLDILRTLFMKT